MKRNFIEELRAKIKKLDAPELEVRIEPQETKADLIIRRFNVHKRSLPIGVDRVVLFNVTKVEAKWWVEEKLKSKCYENGPENSKTLIYFDVVPVDATPKERSIYFNEHPVTTEDVPGFLTPRRIN